MFRVCTGTFLKYRTFFLHLQNANIWGCLRKLNQVQMLKFKVTIKKMHYSCPCNILTWKYSYWHNDWLWQVNVSWSLALVTVRKKMVKPFLFKRGILELIYLPGGVTCNSELGHTTYFALRRCAFFFYDIVMILASFSLKQFDYFFFLENVNLCLC